MVSIAPAIASRYGQNSVGYNRSLRGLGLREQILPFENINCGYDAL